MASGSTRSRESSRSKAKATGGVPRTKHRTRRGPLSTPTEERGEIVDGPEPSADRGEPEQRLRGAGNAGDGYIDVQTEHVFEPNRDLVAPDDDGQDLHARRFGSG